MTEKWSYSSISKQLDLMKGILQIEGEVKLENIRYNNDDRGGIAFCGYYESNYKPIRIGLDKDQLESLAECKTVQDIYECYKEMGYF